MVGSTSSPNKDCKMSQSAEHHIEVGRTRCRDKDGFYGTIRYVGPVASASNEAEVYAGIEWDDATRGKHDGSVICKRTNALVKHFACSNGNTEDRTYATTGASFVRMKKLDLGAVLDRQLLESRYVSPDAKLVAPDNVLPDCYANTSSGKQKKPIEFWGEVKLRQRQQLDSLHHVSLRCMGVSFAASDPSIDGRLEYPHLKSIDLAG